jgi:hypothetical protein
MSITSPTKLNFRARASDPSTTAQAKEKKDEHFALEVCTHERLPLEFDILKKLRQSSMVECVCTFCFVALYHSCSAIPWPWAVRLGQVPKIPGFDSSASRAQSLRWTSFIMLSYILCHLHSRTIPIPSSSSIPFRSWSYFKSHLHFSKIQFFTFLSLSLPGKERLS